MDTKVNLSVDLLLCAINQHNDIVAFNVDGSPVVSVDYVVMRNALDGTSATSVGKAPLVYVEVVMAPEPLFISGILEQYDSLLEEYGYGDHPHEVEANNIMEDYYLTVWNNIKNKI